MQTGGALRGWLLALLVLGISMLAIGCVRPTDRPLSGAPPPAAAATSSPLDRAEAPPTLAPPGVAPPTLAPPGVAPPTPAPGSPTPPAATLVPDRTPVAVTTPSIAPVVTSLRPPASARVPEGQVLASASIVGFARLAEVTATINEQPVNYEVVEHDDRTWTVFFTSALEAGEHRAEVVAQDDEGRRGEASWRFVVGPEPTATPTSSPTPAASPTPDATATSTPVPTPASSPTATSTPTPVPTATPTPEPAALDLVRGMRVDDARTQLTRAGYQVHVEEVTWAAPPGIVVDQSPSDGTVVPYGSDVTLTVSLGRDEDDEE